MALPSAPLGIAVADEGFAYITQPDHGFSGGTLARVDLKGRTVTATIPVGRVPSLVIFNAERTRAYVSNQWSDNIGIVDVASGTQIDTIPTIGDPFARALSPDGGTLLVTTNVNQLFKIDIATKTTLGSIPLPATSHHILMDPHDKSLYVATRDGGTVMEVDWRAMTVSRTFTLGGRPQDMTFAPNGAELYVANEVSTVLHVIDLAMGTFTNIPLAGGMLVNVPIARSITCRTLLTSFATYSSSPFGANVISWGLPPSVKVRLTVIGRQSTSITVPPSRVAT